MNLVGVQRLTCSLAAALPLVLTHNSTANRAPASLHLASWPLSVHTKTSPDRVT